MRPPVPVPVPVTSRSARAREPSGRSVRAALGRKCLARKLGVGADTKGASQRCAAGYGGSLTPGTLM
jgi:hypothetical protein